jgi:hypothetical protein
LGCAQAALIRFDPAQAVPAGLNAIAGAVLVVLALLTLLALLAAALLAAAALTAALATASEAASAQGVGAQPQSLLGGGVLGPMG